MKQTTLKFSAVALFLAACGTVFVRSSLAQKPQADKPVEQTRKNIQVLKGLPDSQLFTVMNFIRTSLGVNCAYCHVNSGGDKWEWEKDDKPTKVIARKMMQMQFALNQGNKDIFGATGGVTCFTCHRGQTRPQVMPTLPQPAPEGGAAGEAKPEPTAPLPTVDQVLDKYVQAIGGDAAFRKLNTRVMKGTHVTFDGTSIPLETYQAAPDKLVSMLTTKAGPIGSGYNGKVGWSRNQRGIREMSGAQLEMMRRASDFYADVKPRETFPNLTAVGREKLGDRETIVLASKVSDTRTEKLYFDAQTGLLLRILAITQTLLAPIPEQTDFEDYREVDGVRLPFTIRQSFVDPWVGWTRKYTEVKHNVAVDATKFDPPSLPK